jgi:hypothetical protein
MLLSYPYTLFPVTYRFRNLRGSPERRRNYLRSIGKTFYCMTKPSIYRSIALIGILSLLSIVVICSAEDADDFRNTLGGVTYNGYGQVVSSGPSGQYAELATPASVSTAVPTTTPTVKATEKQKIAVNTTTSVNSSVNSTALNSSSLNQTANTTKKTE